MDRVVESAVEKYINEIVGLIRSAPPHGYPIALFPSFPVRILRVQFFVVDLQLGTKHMAPPGGATSKRQDCLVSY